ncbi:uncharacterized protein [Hemitrygon akajei]|uniref:uncharacterized protein n=1 Tax=Hemitrygon akajei TaxID=2704970 RepID=UPI003BFA24C8
MKKVFSYDTEEQNYVNRAQMCKWDGTANNQSDLRPICATERNLAKFDFISQEYETSEPDKSEESQQMKKVFSYDTDQQNYVNRAQICKWDGASNNQSDLRPVHATERNATQFDLISQEQYETSEVDKREESQQMKKVFSYDTDQQNYVNRAQMCKWGGASNNQSDVKTTTKYRSCRSIDEDDSTSIRRSGMLSTSQISHNGTSTFHRLVDRQLLSPSNSLTSLRTTCSKRSFTDRKETEHLRNEQNQIHPSEDLRPVRATERNATKFDFISQERYETSEVDKREESQQMKKVFSYDTDQQNCVNRAQMCKWGGASNNQSDVKTTTKYRSCRSIDEDDSTSIRRSGMLSTRQISHNGTSTVHRLVDRQLLTPSNSLTSLHTTCSKRSFTDRKETEYLRSEQNQIHPSEDDYRNYQSPVRSSFCSAGKNVCNRSRERLRVTFSDEILIKNNKLSSRSIPKDDSVSCLKSRMPSTSQMPHQETSSCDQQNRASASFTEHTNTEITGNKSSETQSKLTRAHMGYTDKRLEATKTSSLNSLQPSYNGKTTRHKLPEVDQCGDYNPQIPLGLRSGSSANASSHLQNLLDLVDRHWSGSNSLHRNQRFLNSAEELFFNALDTMAISKIQSLEQKVKVLTEESRSLLTRTASGLDSAEFLHIKHELTQKEDDLESLNGKFEKLIEENKKLHSQLRSLELVNSAGLQQCNEELHRENDRLNLQVKYLNQQIKQHNKLKDAVMMLQESHRAIMSYNNYLQELLNASSTGQRTDMSNVLLKDLGPKR